MRKLLRAVFAVITSISFNTHAYAWGEWGHQHINKAAIFTLPPSLQIFFFNHADYLTYESVVPDIRKYTMADKAEFARHYIDLEEYNYSSAVDMPSSLKDAVGRYGDSTLNKSGILPWYIEVMMDKLAAEMKAGRAAEILFLAADLGHYIADAHMPLHTSVNHDGQLTDQKGIHAFWESQLPELFGYTYNLHTANAHYIKDINKEVWTIIAHSHSLADTLLTTERNLKSKFKGKVYTTDAFGKLLKNKFNQP
ncbi:MAG: S1/P1 Nuclease, partial [Bacteroidetes bacterium]|nr:S1/P1 Nuclease [Bacteroidota bacterium]